MTPGRTKERSGACFGRAPKFPSLPGTTTISTSSDSRSRSGLTSSKRSFSAMALLPLSRSGLGRLGRHLLRLLDGFLDGADHVEGRFGHVVVFAFDDALEALDGVLELHEHPWRSGEDLGYVEGLREEALYLARARHRELVLFGKLLHAENRNDVLQRIVGLEHALHLARDAIMIVADNARIEHARSRVERVHRRIDAELGDLAREHRGGVEMGEGRRGRRV